MSFFEKAVLLYLCFAIACSFWHPEIVFGENQPTNMLTGMFKMNSTNPQNIQFASAELNNSLDSKDSNSGIFKVGSDIVSSFQWVADGLGNVLAVIAMIFKAVFSPFIIFGFMVAGGAPMAVI
jgi:hypothetical protein